MRARFIVIAYISLINCIILNACQSEQEIIYRRYFINGRQIYEQHCENCHGKEGQGLEALIPPLSDTVYLSHNKSRLACIIKFGLSDSITVNGKIYQGKMPGEDHLAAIDIAQVITYISNSFGNSQGLYDVDAAEKDIRNCR